MSRASDDMLTTIVSTSLVIVMAMMGVYLWVVDQLTMQRVFGALLASELLALSMVVYAYASTGWTKSMASWLLAGCWALSAILVYALILSSGGGR